jgi:hypothetical protein
MDESAAKSLKFHAKAQSLPGVSSLTYPRVAWRLGVRLFCLGIPHELAFTSRGMKIGS